MAPEFAIIRLFKNKSTNAVTFSPLLTCMIPSSRLQVPLDTLDLAEEVKIICECEDQNFTEM